MTSAGAATPMGAADAAAPGDSASLLAALDAEQRVAAEALLGPVCILAGAGTGKTRAITHRIAYGVATGVYDPSRVMALTFTARAAGELRTRLRELGASGVSARTFHSAALSQLNYFWPHIVGGSAPTVMSGKARLLGHAAQELKLRLDTPTLRDVAAEIEWRKVSGLDVERYARAGRPTPGRLSIEQLVELQQAYERLKDDRRQLDFEDVLLVTAGLIEQERSVALAVREQYRFFVVDEYQDVSPLQQQLLELWLGDRRELCVVGDASQTIYSFAGASSRYLLDFEKRYDDAVVVRLERDYRSAGPIVHAANQLMRGRPGALTLRPATSDELESEASASAAAAASHPTGAASASDAAPDVLVTEHPNDAAEARWVAQQIAADMASGVSPRDIAVLYRVNAQSVALESALADAGVPYQLQGAQRFFERPEVKQAVESLRAASVSVIGEPLFKSVSDVLRGLGWTQNAPEAPGAVRDKWESLNAIMGLADQAPAGTSFRRFTDELLERRAAQHEPAMQAVTLATLHSAKGLEWHTVHLVGVSEGLVPISHARGLEQIDEERRLMYVGITRARQRLRLSWAEYGQGAEGRGRQTPRSPSRFLDELRSRTPGAGRRPEA